MPPCLRCFADRPRGVLAALLVFTLALSPASARHPATPVEPAVVMPDKVMARKALVEQIKGRVDAALALIRQCSASAAPGDGRANLDAQLASLERHSKDALWTYNVGNYEEAVRRYTLLERNAKTTLLLCDKLRLSVEKCSKSVASALERIRQWGIKIARLQDPTHRAHCETLFTEAEKNLLSLDKTCATTDPMWVARQIPVVIKPLDEALRTGR